MRGSKKMTAMTGEEMRAARAGGSGRSDWARVRRQANADPDTRAINRRIGELIARRGPGRPVDGEPKEAISLRVPHSVLEGWRATGPGWQSRMIAVLREGLAKPTSTAAARARSRKATGG